MGYSVDIPPALLYLRNFYFADHRSGHLVVGPMKLTHQRSLGHMEISRFWEENRIKYGNIYGYIYIPLTIYLWIYISLGNIAVSFGNFWELA
jgi:hypothetical protein